VTDEARLEQVSSGVAPVSDGWFVVNVADAAWLTNDAFGARCVFESDARVLRDNPELEAAQFADLGFRLCVVQPGEPTTMYHRESNQEDFLVLAGECVLLVEGEERALRAWDFVHCPPGTEHAFVGAGKGPCVLLMTGARKTPSTVTYPRSDLALGHGAGVEQETNSPGEAYAPFPHWQPGRPAGDLPWGVGAA
jgi:uncharacterized cupin superfamily protein